MAKDYPIYFSNLRINGYSCFHEIYCMLNKVFTAFVLIFMSDYTIFQGMCLLQFSLLKLCTTIHIKPFQSRLSNFLEISNEFAVLNAMYWLYFRTNNAIPFHMNKTF